MNKRILLVDDEELVLKSLAKLFERDGFKTLVAKSGEEAIKIAGEVELSLIVSDIRMPGMDGVTAIKNIYNVFSQRGFSKIPVIFITGYALEEYEKDAKVLNPAGYVYKPFDILELLNRVNCLLR